MYGNGSALSRLEKQGVANPRDAGIGAIKCLKFDFQKTGLQGIASFQGHSVYNDLRRTM